MSGEVGEEAEEIGWMEGVEIAKTVAEVVGVE